MLPFEIKSDTSKGHPLWPGEEDTRFQWAFIHASTVMFLLTLASPTYTYSNHVINKVEMIKSVF